MNIKHFFILSAVDSWPPNRATTLRTPRAGRADECIGAAPEDAGVSELGHVHEGLGPEDERGGLYAQGKASKSQNCFQLC